MRLSLDDHVLRLKIYPVYVINTDYMLLVQQSTFMASKSNFKKLNKTKHCACVVTRFCCNSDFNFISCDKSKVVKFIKVYKNI